MKARAKSDAEHRNPWDRNRWQCERRALEDRLVALARPLASANMAAVEQRFNDDYQHGPLGLDFRTTLAVNTSGYDTDRARTLVDGRATCQQQLYTPSTTSAPTSCVPAARLREKLGRGDGGDSPATRRAEAPISKTTFAATRAGAIDATSTRCCWESPTILRNGSSGCAAAWSGSATRARGGSVGSRRLGRGFAAGGAAPRGGAAERVRRHGRDPLVG